jgi:DNA repair protein RadA/Sms
VSGTCVTIAVEGRRALPVEIQALIVSTSAPMPRRIVNGVDNSRVAMLLAVLERRAKIPSLSTSDVYVSTVGGIRVTEPGADLAIALAIASAFKDQALPPTLAAIGEISLAGEVRPASSTKQRIAEATRLGFTTILDARCEQIALALKAAFAAPMPREVDAPEF